MRNGVVGIWLKVKIQPPCKFKTADRLNLGTFLRLEVKTLFDHAGLRLAHVSIITIIGADQHSLGQCVSSLNASRVAASYYS